MPDAVWTCYTLRPTPGEHQTKVIAAQLVNIDSCKTDRSPRCEGFSQSGIAHSSCAGKRDLWHEQVIIVLAAVIQTITCQVTKTAYADLVGGNHVIRKIHVAY